MDQIKKVKDIKELSKIVITLAETIEMYSNTCDLEIKNIKKEVNIKTIYDWKIQPNYS